MLEKGDTMNETTLPLYERGILLSENPSIPY
jgi:hypothetical protein